MPGNDLQPIGPHEPAPAGMAGGSSALDWPAAEGAPQESEERTGPGIGRYVAAVVRFKWLILLCTVLGAAGGSLATRFIVPEYEVQANVLLDQGSGTGNRSGGPIQADALFSQTGWRELLTSFLVVDPVVNELGLFVTPAEAADSTLFRAFRADERLRAGDYTLKVSGARWVLSQQPGVEVESGALGDSIGRTVGFRWQPGERLLADRSTVEFSVQTPREASKALISRLTVTIPERSTFIRLNLTGPDAQRTANTLNRWTEQFVATATALKKRNVALYAAILDGQRQYSAEELSSAEAALERFKVQTVTEPTEQTPVAPGLDMTNNTAFNLYFNTKVIAENVQRDRETIERVLAEGRAKGVVSREAVLSVPSVNSDPAADELRRVLAEQSERELQLRLLRERYQNEARQVQLAEEQLERLRTVTVPATMEAYIGQLRQRERQLAAEVDRGGKDLAKIPTRTIEEQRLKRRVEVADAVYRNLDLEAARARMAEAQTIPDVQVLDSAVAPLKPTKNTAPILLLGSIAGGLALGIALAILFDLLDKRFRYPEQATSDLGLFVLGVVPVIRKGKKAGRGQRAAEEAAQVVEGFRSIRMNVRYSVDPSRPLALTITSPGPNDGKSLIASNLALSFAEAGARTLLIDGDIRRGDLASVFGVTPRPGLVEYLDGTALIAEVLHPVAAHANLTVMPGGARRRRAPELLATARLSQLIATMMAEYDVVIVDSPPLGAGYDAYALATATGNMALVLRAGVTDRKAAAAKLATVRTLPIRVIGAVLNSIELTGAYQYYSYYQDYAAQDEAASALPDGEERRSGAVTVSTRP